MKRIIMQVISFVFLCFMGSGVLYAQKTSQSVYQLNDSVVMFEKKTTDVIVDMKHKRKNRNYKLKIPKTVDFNVRSLSKEDDIFVWVKVISIKRGMKGYQNLGDSLKNDIVIKVEQYNIAPLDTVF